MVVAILEPTTRLMLVEVEIEVLVTLEGPCEFF